MLNDGHSDHYFTKGYFQAGNEPGFAVPWAYHYANRPDLTAQRVREVVYKNFNTGIGGCVAFLKISPLALIDNQNSGK